jgi:hypothetical protein
VSAAIGLAANSVALVKREARQLPERVTALPMTAATKVLHTGIVIRSRYDGLVERGDEVLHIAHPAPNGAQGPTSHSASGKHESLEDDTVVPIRPPSRFDAVADGFELIGEDEDEFDGTEYHASDFDNSGDE